MISLNLKYLLLTAVLTVLNIDHSRAFSIMKSESKVFPMSFALEMVSDGLFTEVSKGGLTDGNNIVFSEGCVVQLVSETRAYQVPRKSMGFFQDDMFVPLDFDKDVVRRDMCLVLPKGMRATVARVYDLDQFDASLPIVCKFEEGNALGGEYTPPSSFSMHFDTFEVEVVSE